jgi:hypothetical protein
MVCYSSMVFALNRAGSLRRITYMLGGNPGSRSNDYAHDNVTRQVIDVDNIRDTVDCEK